MQLRFSIQEEKWRQDKGLLLVILEQTREPLPYNQYLVRDTLLVFESGEQGDCRDFSGFIIPSASPWTRRPGRSGWVPMEKYFESVAEISIS